MLLGAGTGFFVKIVNGDHSAMEKWNAVIDSTDDLVVSVLTLNEFLVHFYKKGKVQESKKLVSLMKSLGNIYLIPVSEEIAEKLAGFRHSLGLATVDSVILTTFITQKCEVIYTTDSDLQIAKDRGLANVQLLE